MDTGSCKGDSGAPLFGYIPGQKRNFRVAYGVVHGCIGTCCSVEYPSVFTSLGEKDVLDFVKGVGITTKIHINGLTGDRNTIINIIIPLVVIIALMILAFAIFIIKKSISR